MPWFAVSYPADKPTAGQAAREAGWALRERGGAWMVHADDEAQAAACQAWLDAYQPLALARLSALQLLKGEADRRVAEIISPDQQARAITRRVELLGLPVERAEPLTPAEVAERAYIDGLWEQAKAIRAAADLIVADVLAATDPVALSQFDPAASTRWQEPST